MNFMLLLIILGECMVVIIHLSQRISMMENFTIMMIHKYMKFRMLSLQMHMCYSIKEKNIDS